MGGQCSDANSSEFETSTVGKLKKNDNIPLANSTSHCLLVPSKNSPTLSLSSQSTIILGEDKFSFQNQIPNETNSAGSTASVPEDVFQNGKNSFVNNSPFLLPPPSNIIMDQKKRFKVTYSNGAIYIGELKDTKRHGKGVLTWLNGSSYKGE